MPKRKRGSSGKPGSKPKKQKSAWKRKKRDPGEVGGKRREKFIAELAAHAFGDDAAKREEYRLRLLQMTTKELLDACIEHQFTDLKRFLVRSRFAAFSAGAHSFLVLQVFVEKEKGDNKFKACRKEWGEWAKQNLTKEQRAKYKAVRDMNKAGERPRFLLFNRSFCSIRPFARSLGCLHSLWIQPFRLRERCAFLS